jgi:Protein of unknwon function (DUF3310)
MPPATPGIFRVGDVVTLINGRPGNTATVLDVSTDGSIVKLGENEWVPKCDICLVSQPPFKVGDRVLLKRAPGRVGTEVGGFITGFWNDDARVEWDDKRVTRTMVSVLEFARDRKEEPKADTVNHPSHYTAGGIETIDAIEAMVGQPGWLPRTGYNLGNVLKYLWRHAHKGGLESLKKARWYLEREIAAQEKKP